LSEKHKYNLERWKLLIQDQMNSGLKIIDWCKQNGYTKDSFYYWQNCVRRELLPEALEQLKQAPLVNTSTSSSLVDVTPLAHIPDTGSTALLPESKSTSTPAAVIKRKDVSIDIYESASKDLIQNLIKGLSDA